MFQFKSLTASTKYLSYKEWPVDTFVVGQVIRFATNKMNPKHKDVVVEIIESNVKTDKVTLVKGDLLTINGTTALEKAINAGIEEDDIIKVVYKGKVINKSGEWKGQKSNALEVSVAPAQDKHKVTSKSSEESEDLI